MASMEQAPPGANLRDEGGARPLDALLVRVYSLNWETIFYVVLFVAAILTRFVNLGDRVMSHDESLHTKFSWDLWKNGNFQHTPLMHGPVLFHAVAFFYFLFGDSDFSARLYPAILGIILVMMPKFMFERWLGKLGAMVASVLMLISPMILYHNRYIREDTPSIFFTVLMLYAVMRYVDGVRRPAPTVEEEEEVEAELEAQAEGKPKRKSKEGTAQSGQLRWLLLLSGSTLLSLASKEVAFMYIAIFGGFLTLFWLIQVLGGVVRGETRIGGVVVGGIMAAIVIGGAAFLVGGAIGNALSAPRIIFQGALFGIGCGVAFILRKPIMDLLGELGERAQSTFQVISTGTTLGITASLVMICFVNLIKTKDLDAVANPNAGALMANLIVWVVILAAFCLLAVVGSAIWQFRAQRRLPWVEILSILFIGLVVCGLFLVVEERSQFGTAPEARPTVPNAIAFTWVLGGLAAAGLLFLRFFTKFFEEMKRYPVFDCLVVISTLVLPWVTALPIWLEGGVKLDDNYASQLLINKGIVAVVPFIVVAVVGGLCWNPKAWIACAITFYGIFAFFFTTIFTNPTGIVSGAIGSLGYWLEQQGVRRGSQPQYYYLLVEVPIYEFLPLIGALFAGVLGLLRVFRFRAERVAETTVERATLNAPAEAETEAEAEEIRAARIAAVRANRLNAEALDRFPMIGFLGFWAGMITFALTLSGEKMPWLTTHIAVPMIFVTGWFLGKILEHVDWRAFFRQSWYLILLTPLLIIGAANLIGPVLFGQLQLTDLSLLRDNLLVLGAWLFALMITGGTLYAIWLILRRVGVRETLRVMLVGVFVLLGVLTARAAWRFAFIDYDYATEFGVYAHGAPAMKTVMDKLEQLSKSTTDSMGIKVAYDNEVSWPGSWYFRNYTQARFLGDPSGGVADLDQNAAVLVSYAHKPAVDPSLGDNYYKFEYIRMWWPMQDYFDLNANRVNNVFMNVEGGVDPGKLRQGLWDIWWNRDYKAYGQATSKNFETNQWPVADRMVFYVRKDVAAQVWDLGVGNVSPITIAPDPFTKLRCNECRADLAIGTAGQADGQLNSPRGVRIGPDGNLYVADTRNGRIVVFDPNGQYLRTIGTMSTNDQTNSIAPAGTLREPWAVAVAKDGTIVVADTWNHRVQVFNAQGQLLRAFGHYEQVKPGDAGSLDGFWGPRDIAVDASNNIYVADTGNKRIRVYDLNGTMLRTIGQPGAGTGQLNEPVGLAIDSNAGRLYVADSWNKRVQVFTTDGAPITNWKVPTWYGPSDDTGNRPYLALDPAGQRLYAAEPDTGRILVWDLSQVTSAGGEQALITFGSKGQGDMNRFGGVGGLTVDNNSLYVVDAVAARVLKFSIDKLPGVRPIVPVVQPTQVQPTALFTEVQPTNAQPTQVQPTQVQPTNVQPTNPPPVSVTETPTGM